MAASNSENQLFSSKQGDAFGVSVWFELYGSPGVGTARILFSNNVAGVGGLRCAMDNGLFNPVGATQSVRVWSTDDGGTLDLHTVPSATPLLSGWHHLYLAYDGAAGALYIDGKPAASEQGIVIPTLAPFNLGMAPARASGISDFWGVLADLRIYSGNADASEVAALYNVDSDGNGLPDWWERQYFGSVGADPSLDYSGDGYTILQKYDDGLDPTKFLGFSSIALKQLSGASQVGSPGGILPIPLDFAVYGDGGALPVRGVPVNLSAPSGGFILDPANPASAPAKSVKILSDPQSGIARVWYVCPTVKGSSVAITAKAGSSASLTFQEYTSDPSGVAGLVGRWRFEEGGGTSTFDASGNGNTGFLLAPQWTTRAFEGLHALQFGGGDGAQRLRIANDLGQLLPAAGPAPFSVSVWMRCNAPPLGGAAAIFDDSNGRSGFRCAVDNGAWQTAAAGARIRVWSTEDGGSIDLSAPLPSATATEWRLVTVVFDGAVASLYLDGSLAATEAGSIVPGNAPFSMAAKAGADPQVTDFNGTLDDLQIYSTALLPVDIATLYNVDNDGNGLPDWWEQKYFGKAGLNPASSPVGNAFTLLQDFQQGIDPTDYWAGAPPSLTIYSGNGQTGPAGSILSTRLVVLAKDATGAPMPGLNVGFSTTAGILTDQGTNGQRLLLRTNSQGYAGADAQMPASPGVVSVHAQALPANAVPSAGGGGWSTGGASPVSLAQRYGPLFSLTAVPAPTGVPFFNAIPLPIAAFGVNNFCEVAGSQGDSAAIWKNGYVSLLGFSGGPSVINNNGDVAGSYPTQIAGIFFGSKADHAFVWTPLGFTDLSTQASSNSSIAAINDTGAVAGFEEFQQQVTISIPIYKGSFSGVNGGYLDSVPSRGTRLWRSWAFRTLRS